VRAGDSVVVMEGVRKRYSRRSAWVLGGVDLALARSSGVVVVGSNGSGKSTLLRLMVGLAIPTAGVIDRNAASMAYAPERLAGNIRMPARLYLSHMAAMRHVERDLARERIDTLARRFGLVPGLDAPIRSLSKGNSQKVALIQAFLAPVELFVLDEPFSGLDGGARAALSERSGWAFLVAAVMILADTLVPGAPPTRQVLGRLSSDHPGNLGSFVIAVALETVALAVALVAVSSFVARRRD
jgi:ABC-2 type transport system ATP-binding protein